MQDYTLARRIFTEIGLKRVAILRVKIPTERGPLPGKWLAVAYTGTTRIGAWSFELEARTINGFLGVVAVGGTSLVLNSAGTRVAEDVWNENGPDDDNAVFEGYWVGGAMGASGAGRCFGHSKMARPRRVARS